MGLGPQDPTRGYLGPSGLTWAQIRYGMVRPPLFRQVDDQLPEMAWGFDCDFHNDLWSCALPPEAESLLDRSFSLQDMIRASAKKGTCTYMHHETYHCCWVIFSGVTVFQRDSCLLGFPFAFWLVDLERQLYDAKSSLWAERMVDWSSSPRVLGSNSSKVQRILHFAPSSCHLWMGAWFCPCQWRESWVLSDATKKHVKLLGFLTDFRKKTALWHCFPLQTSPVSQGTGSETLSQMLAESSGLHLHDHQCNAHTCLCVEELVIEKHNILKRERNCDPKCT